MGETGHRNFFALLLCLACLYSFKAHRSVAMETEQITLPDDFQKFMRGAYFPFERLDWVARKANMEKWDFVDKLLADLRQKYYMDAIWVVNVGTEDARRLCRLAQKHNIAVFVTPEPVIWWRQLRGKDVAHKIAQHAFNSLGDLKAFRAYVLVDEPRVWELAQMENIRSALAAVDKERIALMVTMTQDTEGAGKYTKFPIIVSDIYPFFAPKSPNGPNNPAASQSYFITCTERLAEIASVTGKLAWVMPQVCAEIWGKWHYDGKMHAVIEPGAYWHYRMPTIGETRWQIWQSIAAGAKGVIFFVLFPAPNDRKPGEPSEEGLIPTSAIHPDWPRVSEKLATNAGTALLYNDGSPTPQLLAIAETFALLETNQKLLWRLRPSIPFAFTQPPFRTSTFVDPADGSGVIVVVNDETDNEREGEVAILPPTEFVQDLLSGRKLPTKQDEVTGLRKVRLSLAAGSGTLLRIAPNGISRVSCIFVDDFSVQTSAGQFHNIERTFIPVGWGMGFRIGIQAAAVNGQIKTPSWVQYELPKIAANWYETANFLFAVCEGSGVEVWVSSNGVEFERIAEVRTSSVIPLQTKITHIRFVLASKGAKFTKWWLLSVKG